MRVISGTAKGRTLKAVPGKRTRPTTDKVKEAVFSIIGPYFDGGKVLDLFAGTGGLGIEALSRGAEQAIFIDMDPVSVSVIRTNLQAAQLQERAEIYRNEAMQAIKQLAKRGLVFDYIFLDPPYRMVNMDELAIDMLNKGLIAEQATVVIEHDTEVHYADQIQSLTCIRRASYGEITVSIYTNELTEERK